MTAVDTHLELRVTAARLGAGAHVASVSGVLDAASAPELAARLGPLAEQAGATTLIVDLVAVSFADPAGLDVLGAAARRLQASGGELVLVADDPRLRRLVQSTGLLPPVRFERTLARAVEHVLDGVHG